MAFCYQLVTAYGPNRFVMRTAFVPKGTPSIDTPGGRRPKPLVRL